LKKAFGFNRQGLIFSTKEVKMRKLMALILVGLFFVPFFFLFAKPVSADQGDTAMCYDEYDICWMRAVNGDHGKIKTTLMLTVCDLALGTCLLRHALN
jgi:hypothetical protein